MKGGSYIVEKDGDVKLVERTQPHPDGPGARDAEGRLLDGQGRAQEPTAKPKAARATRTPGTEEGSK